MSNGGGAAETIDDTIPNAWVPVAAARTFAAPIESSSPSNVSSEPVSVEASPPSQVERAVAAAPARAPLPIEVPKVSMELPSDSGLVLVETARERATAIATEQESEQPRQRRQRPPRQQLPDEPLQLVETHKEPPAA
jgi:hypothetical protein